MRGTKSECHPQGQPGNRLPSFFASSQNGATAHAETRRESSRRRKNREIEKSEKIEAKNPSGKVEENNCCVYNEISQFTGAVPVAAGRILPIPAV